MHAAAGAAAAAPTQGKARLALRSDQWQGTARCAGGVIQLQYNLTPGLEQASWSETGSACKPTAAVSKDPIEPLSKGLVVLEEHSKQEEPDADAGNEAAYNAEQQELYSELLPQPYLNHFGLLCDAAEGVCSWIGCWSACT